MKVHDPRSRVSRALIQFGSRRGIFSQTAHFPFRLMIQQLHLLLLTLLELLLLLVIALQENVEAWRAVNQSGHFAILLLFIRRIGVVVVVDVVESHWKAASRWNRPND